MDAGRKRELEEKVRSGERLTRDDGNALYASDDLAWLGGLAHEARTRRHGDAARFTVERHLTATDGCAPWCAYCTAPGGPDGADGPGGPDAEPMGVEDAVARAGELAGEHLTGLRVCAGRRTDLPWRHYPDALRTLGAALPGTALTAFTASDVHRFATAYDMPASAVLDELVDAGLTSLAGDDARHLHTADDEGAAGDGAIGWDDWARIHRLAHRKGLTASCALGHGRAEAPGHRVDHLLRLRELQDETGGFTVFAPLRHRPAAKDAVGGGAHQRGRAVTGAEVLKTFAVGRLLLDNVPHIRVFWPEYGLRTTQLVLQHGADDLGGRIVGHEVPPAGDPDTPDRLSREDVVDLIRDAGLRPVERDGRFETVQEYEGPDPARREAPQPMRL